VAKQQGEKMDFLNITEKEVLSSKDLKVLAVDTVEDMYNEMVRLSVNRIKENNSRGKTTSFILPVGPTGQYRRLARVINMERIDCSNLITINMDEYLDEDDRYVPEDHPLSFIGFMKKNFFDLIGPELKVRPENIYFPDPDNPGEVGEVVDSLGGVDICFAGIGINGHIAFNEAMDESSISNDDFRKLKTRTLGLAQSTVYVNSSLFAKGHTELIPPRCITIGMDEILRSKEIVCCLEYIFQSAVVRKMIAMKPTPAFPATFIKEHKNSYMIATRGILQDYTL
jgi:glucosamine-6-phosphate deaminase